MRNQNVQNVRSKELNTSLQKRVQNIVKEGIRGSTLHIVINVVTFMEFSIKLVYHLQLSSQLFKLW